MEFWGFIVAIVFITTAGNIASQALKNRAKAEKNQSNEEYEQRLAVMEERLQTLERIVTDKKTDLRDKIESL